MKQPPSIKPAPVPGPAYDPMDRIVQDLQNIESFLLFLSSNPKNLEYLNTHLSSILGLRRSIAQQLEKLAEEPYNYSSSRLQKLHEENENIFIYLEGAVGEMMVANEKIFKKSIQEALKMLSEFDRDLTP